MIKQTELITEIGAAITQVLKQHNVEPENIQVRIGIHELRILVLLPEA